MTGAARGEAVDAVDAAEATDVVEATDVADAGAVVERARERSVPWRLLVVGLLVALALAGGLSLYASQSPDGLEKVAADQGFGKTEKEHTLTDSPLGDYEVDGIADPRFSGGLAGVAGVFLTLALGGGLFWAVRRRAPAPAARPHVPTGRPADVRAGEPTGVPADRPPAGPTDVPAAGPKQDQDG